MHIPICHSALPQSTSHAVQHAGQARAFLKCTGLVSPMLTGERQVEQCKAAMLRVLITVGDRQ